MASVRRAPVEQVPAADEATVVPADGLSVVVPAFNEQHHIGDVVRGVLDVMRSVARRFEIIVVDDGSADQTRGVVAALMTRHREVRLVRHEQNRGYGAALRSGFSAARYEWVFFTDGDGQFDVREIVRLLPLAPTADIVAGYRLRRQDPWHRRLAGVVFGRVLVPLVLGVRVRDVNCAFKLIRRNVLRRLTLRSDGATINAELLGQSMRRGARVVQVGVPHRPRRGGVATGGRPRVAWAAIRDLPRLRRELGAASAGRDGR